jgi:hypothetical protein
VPLCFAVSALRTSDCWWTGPVGILGWALWCIDLFGYEVGGFWGWVGVVVRVVVVGVISVKSICSAMADFPPNSSISSSILLGELFDVLRFLFMLTRKFQLHLIFRLPTE